LLEEANHKPTVVQFVKSKLTLLAYVYCVAALISTLWLVVQSVVGIHGGRSPFGTPDYAGFYVAASILNRGQAQDLYNEGAQFTLLHTLLPEAAPEVRYPFGHAPLVAFLFRPLARMSFDWSYRIWILTVPVIALASLIVLRGAAKAIPREDWVLIAMVAMTFPPLLVECWLAGQLSVIGLFWVSLAFRSIRLARPFACGIALAMCAYKPTLLLFCLPILLLSRQPAILAGLAAGALFLTVVTVIAVGTTACMSFLDMLASYARHAEAGMPGFKVFKQVDLNSFLTLMQGGHTTGVRLIMALAGLAAAAILLRAWYSCARADDEARILVLGATITWNSVFNLYTPIYDVTLVIPGLIMTGEVIYGMTRERREREARVFIGLMVSLILGEWYTQTLARDHGIQLLTPILAVVGIYQLALARVVARAAISPDAV
jgi:hypothetical protein